MKRRHHSLRTGEFYNLHLIYAKADESVSQRNGKENTCVFQSSVPTPQMVNIFNTILSNEYSRWAYRIHTF